MVPFTVGYYARIERLWRPGVHGFEATDHIKSHRAYANGHNFQCPEADSALSRWDEPEQVDSYNYGALPSVSSVLVFRCLNFAP